MVCEDHVHDSGSPEGGGSIGQVSGQGYKDAHVSLPRLRFRLRTPQIFQFGFVEEELDSIGFVKFKNKKGWTRRLCLVATPLFVHLPEHSRYSWELSHHQELWFSLTQIIPSFQAVDLSTSHYRIIRVIRHWSVAIWAMKPLLKFVMTTTSPHTRPQLSHKTILT